jgi:hypothetical protein
MSNRLFHPPSLGDSNDMSSRSGQQILVRALAEEQRFQSKRKPLIAALLLHSKKRIVCEGLEPLGGVLAAGPLAPGVSPRTCTHHIRCIYALATTNESALLF